MTDYVIPPAATPSLAVSGSAARFPIRRVFCVGRNYRWPGATTEREAPFFFMKPADAVNAAEGQIPFPPLTAEFCHEIELVVAIGKDGAGIAAVDAPAHVWGYAVGLDLTRRDQQTEAKQLGRPWEGAKAFDHSAPCTALVPVEARGHPKQGAVWLKVNGEMRQQSDLADLIWPIADLISVISHSVALKAGDLIFSGTPSGVAALEPGDAVTGGIAGIGEFSMTIGPRPSLV
jgi:fumarylpyruvate hydrolase